MGAFTERYPATGVGGAGIASGVWVATDTTARGGGRALTEWINGSAGLRTATRTQVCRDGDDPTHYMEIFEFDSYDDAMVNSELAVTNANHEAFVPLCTDGPRFINLDVVWEGPWQL